MSSEHDRIRLVGVTKNFTMHLRGGAVLSVVEDVTFNVPAGKCVVLGGPSGIGKSSILKMIYGNYLSGRGQILIRDDRGWTDIAAASPRRLLEIRSTTLGYVSQFLRTIPRVSAFDIVVTAAQSMGGAEQCPQETARKLLTRLNVPERIWSLAPSTFSGGEQQRINIACGFAQARPVMLLDEPTASLDQPNREVVIDLVNESKQRGAAILGIFHDEDVRTRVADEIIDVAQFQPKVPAHA